MKLYALSLSAALAAGLVAFSFAGAESDGGGLHAKLAKFLHGDQAIAAHVASHLDSMAEDLDLTPAQRDSVAAIVTASLPDLETKVAALVDAHAEQFERIHAPVFDEPAIREASAAVGVAQTELAVAAARALNSMHGVLSPEQLARLECLPRTELHGLALTQVRVHVLAVKQGLEAWASRQ